MSSDEEDGLCRFGTPLDPIEEDEVPKTKKITLADQIAVDSNGRRRFHGAFTGGFSAGFWNTVGSREGWTPSEFKSSRAEKASRRVQSASDFMDEEDVGEFGIAPQRIQTTEDFGPTESHQKNKRKHQSDSSQGPIPGVPVLELVLESCHDKAAVRLLKRMDKRYEAALSEKLKRSALETKEPAESIETMETQSEDADEVAQDTKVYKCDMGPIQLRRSGSHDDDSSEDEELVFDTDEFDVIFNNLKSNRFGLNYVGLEKGNFFETVGSEAPNIQNNFSILPTFTMVDQNKKKVTIKGQAFGVGAFEEDDDDIYGRDDMSKYDFRLDTKAEKQISKSTKENRNIFISGFNDSSNGALKIRPKNVFKVRIPFGFEPRHWLKRKSRFGPEVENSNPTIKGPADKVIGRHDLTPDERGRILGDKPKKDTASDIEAKLKAAGLKPLNFTSGGTENESNSKEANEDVLSSKIDENLAKIRNKSFVVPESIPQLFDRFTSSNESKPLSELDSNHSNQTKVPVETEATPREVQKVVRTKQIWVPCQLLCYKMNMEASVGSKPEKGNTFSLFECIASTETARRNRLEFTSVQPNESDHRDQVDVKKVEPKKVEVEKSQEKPIQTLTQPNVSISRLSEEQSKPRTSLTVKTSAPTESSKKTDKVETKPVKRIQPKTELEKKIFDAQDEHPSKKKDIFKAIFDSDSESDSDSEQRSDVASSRNSAAISADLIASLSKPSTSGLYAQLPDEAFRPKSAREINILRNNSPPRGIFSGLIQKPNPTTSTDLHAEKEKPIEETQPDTYGPSLPPVRSTLYKGQPETSQTNRGIASVSLGKHSDYKIVYEEKWIEKSDDIDKKSKKEKKEKKHKKEKKSKKDKKYKKHKKRR